MDPFVKRDATAPAGFFACEVAGLRWLGAVDDGVPCAEVLSHDAVSLTLTRLTQIGPGAAAAREFGRRLARTHDAGARAFGSAPDGWLGPGFFGPLGQPLPMTFGASDSWGSFYAAERLLPMLELASPRLPQSVRGDVERLAKRCARGDFDDGDGPARVHGDLWNGNVMWTSNGVILIDPAAHGGHRETDLAMLALFGCPFADDVIGGYQDGHPLRPGWPDRLPLHQLHPLLAHVVLFGSGYVAAAARAAERALTIDG